MSYMVRDRSDGQVEIVFSTPVLVGVFPERDLAEKVCAFLCADEPELPDNCPSSFARAMRDVVIASDDDLDVIASADASKPAARPTSLPAQLRRHARKEADEKPHMAAQINHNSYWPMTDEETQAAFARIAEGEKINVVAMDYPVSMGQLRGKWANHKRGLQKHLAEGGQQPCKLCTRPFTPSISHPDTCARCSK